MASADELTKIIAAINPKMYLDGTPSQKELFKRVVKNKGIKDGLKELKDDDNLNGAKPTPLVSYTLTYDSPVSQLEPIYFWLLDFLKDLSDAGLDKITDNFTSSPGSGHFAEIGARGSKMQEEGMKILGLINQVIKAVINLIYDLKEFEIRLEHYKKANSEDAKEKEEGMLALKQIWLDNVDTKRGRGSIHQMAYEMGYSTIREAFMIANSVDEIEKMAGREGLLNDQVKRILIPRISEFLTWKNLSEKELAKRFEIEKSYLKSEVESLKLYVSWARPYLKAAEELRMKGFEKNPSLVSAFNTSMFELVLFGKSKIDLKKNIVSKRLPPGFSNYEKKYRRKRQYYACQVVSLIFRGIPQRMTQQGHYSFGGRVDIKFDSYALNDEELKILFKQLEDDDMETSLRFVQENADTALLELKEDLDKYIGAGKKKEEKEREEDDTNPFTAIFELFKFKKSKEEKKEIKTTEDIKSDDYVESYLRKLAADSAQDNIFTIYDIYKKAHGMASSPEPFDNPYNKDPTKVGVTDVFK